MRNIARCLHLVAILPRERSCYHFCGTKYLLSECFFQFPNSVFQLTGLLVGFFY